MSSVKRYHLMPRKGLVLDSETKEPVRGAWVHYDDYAALERECKELRAENSLMGDSFEVMTKAGIEQQDRAEAAESKLSSVMEWMRGRCECCGNNVEEVESGMHPCHTCTHREPMYRYIRLPGTDNWTPPKELEG